MGHKKRTHEPKRTQHHALADLAKRQHGVVSVRQLEALGYSRYAVARAARAGRLHRLYRGVYAVGHRSLTPQGHCLAAVLSCAPNALASHASAAWLWDLFRSPPGTIHVTAPTRRHARPGLSLHYARLTDEDRALLDGVPATALPRTLLDIAVTLPHRLDRALERSEELRHLDLRQMEALLLRAGGHPGAGRLRRALVIYRDEPAFTRSGLERRFLDLVRRSDLALPSTCFLEGGYELDAYWPSERFAVELDVYETHGGRAAFERDRLRQEDLKLMGIEMIRITGPRLDREPERVIERVAALLEQRRRQLRIEDEGDVVPLRGLDRD
jgi:hypothetical protein